MSTPTNIFAQVIILLRYSSNLVFGGNNDGRCEPIFLLRIFHCIAYLLRRHREVTCPERGWRFVYLICRKLEIQTIAFVQQWAWLIISGFLPRNCMNFHILPVASTMQYSHTLITCIIWIASHEYVFVLFQYWSSNWNLHLVICLKVTNIISGYHIPFAFRIRFYSAAKNTNTENVVFRANLLILSLPFKYNTTETKFAVWEQNAFVSNVANYVCNLAELPSSLAGLHW